MHRCKTHTGLHMSCCVTQQVLEGAESCTESASWAAGAQQSDQEPAHSDPQPSKTCQMVVKVSFSKGWFLVPEHLGPILNTLIGNYIFEAIPFQRADLFSTSQVWFKVCHLLVLRRKPGSDRAVHGMKPVLLPGSSASLRTPATAQHEGKESRAWVTCKFLFLEAVINMINHFLLF